MTTYNTYQEAKIANPDENIRHLDGKLFVSENSGVPYERRHDWLPASPAKYCMTVEKFLADGNKFIEGDAVVNSDGVVKMPLGDIVRLMNIPSKYDVNSFILRAAALETQMNIDNLATQTPEEKEALDSINSVHLRDYQKVNTTPHQYEMSKFSGKPHAKVEYVKVTESIFNLREEFERGELHYVFSGENWFTFNDEASLVVGFKEGNVYRRIEITETPQQREEREREEMADTACENMFGESIQNCRPDVVATVRCMIDAGYRKESN